MGTPRGILPSRTEFEQWIREHSELQLPNYPGYAVSTAYYKRNKHATWRAYESVLYAYGYENTTGGWRQFIHDLTGLHCPTRTEIGIMRKGKALDEGVYTSALPGVPNTPLEIDECRGDEHLSTMSVLHCRQLNRTEPVRMWDPYRSRSVLVPASTVYQVV